MFLTLLKGFATGGGLIVAIGAQNAFVLRQGLLRRHLLLTALTCATIDALLITLGVMGFGQVISKYPLLLDVSKLFAAAFLFFYGALSCRSVFKRKALVEGAASSSIKTTLLLLLGFSLLNPHVYLDTVILLGSIASNSENPLYFGVGAIFASFVWFFALTYGSGWMAPLLRHPNACKAIDAIVALTMWTIATLLLMA